MHMCVCTQVCMCAHVYVVCIQMRVCDVCTWVCGKFIHPGTCVCMCVCVVGTQVHVWGYVHTDLCICCMYMWGCMYSCVCIVCVCVVCIQVPVCVLCTHGCVCLCACMYVCVVCTQGYVYVYGGCTQMHVACWDACTQGRGSCPRLCAPLYQSLSLSTLFPQVGFSLDLQLSEQPAHPGTLAASALPHAHPALILLPYVAYVVSRCSHLHSRHSYQLVSPGSSWARPRGPAQ